MIQLLPITNSAELNVDFKQIYEEAFPPDERREWQQLTELLTNSIFTLNEIYFQHQFIGFISIWNLNEFSFIEHFAIRDTERGKGFGTQVIQQIIAQNPGPVILEVEEPLTDMAQKRISFYENLNFSVSEEDYYQPPYSIGKNKVKMQLMSYPEKIRHEDFAENQSKIYQLVYHFKE
ncbi:MAG TPA: GNAT family N-acetyltransferase [Prolixibacteraceae bacterium]|nr:GNAT family N-acetyltransferase [Prolixibacteraceae bacterium]